MLITNKIKNQKCIEECKSCEQACLEGIKLCLNESEPNVQARIECIDTLNKCASISNLASRFISMDAKEAKNICMVCAAICEKAASECHIFEDNICAACEAECKKCANECKKIAS